MMLKKLVLAAGRPAAWLAVLLLAAGSVWLLAPRGRQELRASIVAAVAPAAVAPAEASGFARAEGPRPLRFPADHGPHDDYQTEWWYFTGNLVAETGERFGYQLTFFRRALLPPGERAARTSSWASEQVYMAHFAVTDAAGGRHDAFERLARGAAGIAGARAEPFRVWLEDWEVAEAPPAAPASGAPWRLRAAAGRVALDLTLASAKAPVLHGDGGYSRKGPEPDNASYYYSLTRLATAGSVSAGGRSYRVEGLSWMDHEFSTSALGEEQVGWDWFSVQLDDGTELMLFQLRRADGSVDAFSSGTLVAADGSVRTLAPRGAAAPAGFTIGPTGTWRSPRTGGAYPSGWVLAVPEADLQLTLTPRLADQEMAVSYAYWEGAVEAQGTAGGRAVSGSGYVELTGYAGSMRGQF